MAELRTYGIDGLHGLLHHFRPDAVAGKFRDFQFHLTMIYLSMIFNILSVALMAASV